MSAGRNNRRKMRRTALLFVMPSIPDDADPAVKDALAIRNAATTAGRCPHCGAGLVLEMEPEAGSVVHAWMGHEDGCPALLGGAG